MSVTVFDDARNTNRQSTCAKCDKPETKTKLNSRTHWSTAGAFWREGGNREKRVCVEGRGKRGQAARTCSGAGKAATSSWRQSFVGIDAVVCAQCVSPCPQVRVPVIAVDRFSFQEAFSLLLETCLLLKQYPGLVVRSSERFLFRLVRPVSARTGTETTGLFGSFCRAPTVIFRPFSPPTCVRKTCGRVRLINGVSAVVP